MTSDTSVLISPSVLSADFANLGRECRALEKAGADRIHWDVMDGHFVPNLSMGADIIGSCRDEVALPFEAHLMVNEPDHLLEGFVGAGCNVVMVHAEACTHLHRTLSQIKELGASPGLVLNPHTSIDPIRHVMDVIDIVLIMSVNPGFGGQSHIPAVVPKICEARALLDTADRWIDIEVDGGINAETIEAVSRCGANIFVAGSSVFGHPNGYEKAIGELRSIGAAARDLRQG